MKNVCHICLSNESPFYSLKNDKLLLQKLEDFISSQIIIEESEANIICLTCMVKLNESHNFQQLIKKSNSLIKIQTEEPNLKRNSSSHTTSNVSFKLETVTDEMKSLSKNELSKNALTTGSHKKKKLRIGKDKLSSKRFPTKGTSLVNLKDDIDFSYLCDKCDKNFKTKSALNLHLIDHRNKPTFTCRVCKESFVLSASLHAHMQKHAEVNRYKCSVCNRSYNVIDLLERHMKMHGMQKPQICEYCHLAFVSQIDLNKHVFQVHKAEKLASLS